MENDESGDIKYQLILLYKGYKGIHILRSMEKYVRKPHRKYSTLQITDTGNKLSSQFNIKDKSNFEHQDELKHHINCPIPTFCTYIIKHRIEKYHYNASQENFKIIAKNFRNHKWK